VIVMPHWDAEGTLAVIAEKGVRHTHLVPTMFVRLLRLSTERRTAFDPSALSLVLHGAASVARETKRAMIDWWGPVLVEYWGATESGVCTLASSAEWLAHPGTVGRTTPSFDVFAVDESGARLPPGEIGTLCIEHRRFDRPFEYHRAREKTEEAYIAGRAFGVGDLGFVDTEGFVFLSDRKAHTIISGGVNIYPAEVEAAVSAHPAVSDVAVFGIPDDEWGEQVKAAVELVPGHRPSKALESEILAFAREKLAHYKVPRSIDFEERLPRHDTGKLYTRLLRDRYWKGRARSI
jgi:long-chain acyl-CoA synthetase